MIAFIDKHNIAKFPGRYALTASTTFTYERKLQSSMWTAVIAVESAVRYSFTAISRKVVPQKPKSVRDNADWYYG